MVYTYRGKETIEAELERQEQLKAELAAEREKLKEAMRIRKENERLEAQILRTQQRAADLAKPARTLPEPIHGGYKGLKQAVAERDNYNRRKRQAA
jgi:septal ring factor EnvC (AmiA/AmiB activator)